MWVRILPCLQFFFYCLFILVKPLYTKIEFENSKCNEKLPLECYYCNGKFFQEKRVIQRAVNKSKKHSSRFCSTKCFSEFHKKRKECDCKNCGKKFEKILSQVSENNFCSSSCSAKYNNKNRKKSTKRNENISKGIRMFHEKKGTLRYESCNLFIGECASCKKPIASKHRKKYCGLCIDDKKTYALSCRFTFNIYDYKEKFDLTLIEKYGWYSTPGSNRKGIKNINGISRDHLFSITDGFLQRVSPEIMRHPANCNILRHKENQQKNIKSSITLEELLNRIKNW